MGCGTSSVDEIQKKEENISKKNFSHEGELNPTFNEINKRHIQNNENLVKGIPLQKRTFFYLKE